MKIYANSYDKDDLGYYVGKDVWVKVIRSDGGALYYIRILSLEKNRYNSDIITFNRIKAHIVENFNPTMKTLSMLLNETHRSFLSDYYIDEPIEILTTDEIIDIFERKNEQ